MAEDIFSVFSEVTRRLESANVPYMVVGSVASMIYGEPRLTKDMDLVIDLLPAGARRLAELFPLDEFYCPPEEALSAELAERGQFNLIHHSTGIKVDLIVRKTTEHAVVEFSRRRREPLWEDYDAYIASPEDVIVKKLQHFRDGGSEKHLRDIRGILAHCELDDGYLQGWIRRLGLESEWGRI
jgi:hypothetical protein